MIDVLVDTKNTAELDVLPERMDVHKADMLEQEERRDATSYRYERLYWESVPEDADVSDPVCVGASFSYCCTRNLFYPTSYNTSRSGLKLNGYLKNGGRKNVSQKVFPILGLSDDPRMMYW
jgi:hypothetical protein